MHRGLGGAQREGWYVEQEGNGTVMLEGVCERLDGMYRKMRVRDQAGG